MKRTLARRVRVATLVLAGGLVASGCAFIERSSVGPGGTEGNGPSEVGLSERAVISESGRYVAYSSDATNLVTGDTNGITDVFVHDHSLDTTTRVSVSTSGEEANGESHQPAISATGRYVAFLSLASNLVAGDTNIFTDVFVRDRDVDGNGIFDEPGLVTTVQVNIAADGTPANSPTGYPPAISDDGRHVTFQSTASNLDDIGDDIADNVFVHDRDADADGTFDETDPGARKTTRVNVQPPGLDPLDDGVQNPAVSGSGRFVAFASFATTQAPNDTNNDLDVFVSDRDADTDGIFDESDAGAMKTVRVSVDSNGGEATGGVPDSDSNSPSLSDDGRYVAFDSRAASLVPDDTNGFVDAFVHDRDADVDGTFDEADAGARETIRISLTSDDDEAIGARVLTRL